MRHETYEYIQHGVWNRRQELLDEARYLHIAGRAVREARQARIERSDPANTRLSPTFVSAATRGLEQAWRAAVGRVGTVMVNAGHRLESLACRAANLS